MSVGKTLSVPFLVLSLATAPLCLVASPEQLILKFSEGLEIKFTSVKVIGPDGKAAPTGAPSLDPNDKTSLIVPVKRPLAAGKYEVEWHAVAVDTHKTQGSG
jgi:copper resistance protein C